MTENAEIFANGAGETEPKPLDFTAAFDELDTELNFAEGHLKALRFLVDMARNLKGDELRRGIDAATWLANELQTFACNADSTVNSIREACRREGRTV